MMRRLPRAVIVALKLLIAVGLVAFVASTTDLELLLQRVSHLSVVSLVAGTALVLLWASLNTLRWGLVLRGLGQPRPARETWTLGMVGLFFSQFLPSSIGGDAVRIALINRRGVPLDVAFGSTLTDRAVALLFFALVLVVAAPAIAGLLHDWRLSGAVCGAALVVCAAGAVPLLPVAWQRLMPRWLKPLGAAVEHYRFTLLHSPYRAALLGLSALAYIFPSLTFYVFARDLGVGLSLVDCLLLVPPVILAMAVPISFAGWGVREVGIVALFGAVGVAAADSLVMSVAFGATSAAGGLIGGVVWQLSGLRRPLPRPPTVPSP
jgi:glycosyltransferase 2 family protein